MAFSRLHRFIKCSTFDQHENFPRLRAPQISNILSVNDRTGASKFLPWIRWITDTGISNVDVSTLHGCGRFEICHSFCVFSVSVGTLLDPRIKSRIELRCVGYFHAVEADVVAMNKSFRFGRRRKCLNVFQSIILTNWLCADYRMIMHFVNHLYPRTLFTNYIPRLDPNSKVTAE